MEHSYKQFLGAHFLLDTKAAQVLYHDYAKSQPIIDYHNHLSPAQIANNIQFQNLTQAWLDGDHYKWRAMRALGIEEQYITGAGSDADKFLKWAEAVPQTIRNPLFHWTHLELRRYFDINDLLNKESAELIYEKANEVLMTDDYSTQGLLRQMNVEVVCTTDDPIDDLKHHRKMRSSEANLIMGMSFRPDQSLLIERESFHSYIHSLGQAASIEIRSFEDILESLLLRMEHFHANGCRLCDHGLEYVPHEPYTLSELNAIVKKRLNKKSISERENNQYKTALLFELCKSYAQKGWVQQFHLGALRNTNDRMLKTLGPDTGFDSIGDFSQASTLASFLNDLDKHDLLAKTIVYNLNPRDNEMLAAMIGNFNDGSIRGKMQFGSAWWFLDQKDGMEKQLNALSNLGMLSRFVGMLTDSRSFLSFPRHEYFRRILCNLIGRDVHNGELPNDLPWLGKIVQDICYNNAKEYFDFQVEQEKQS